MSVISSLSPLEEISATQKVLASGNVNYWTGNEGKQFESDFANYTGCKHAVAVSNGTVALELALEAIGIQPGDEVITQGFNFIATIESIIDCGAKPVIAPIDEYLNMDKDATEKLITKKTKVILCVHLFGHPADVESLKEICKKNQIYLFDSGGRELAGGGQIGIRRIELLYGQC